MIGFLLVLPGAVPWAQSLECYAVKLGTARLQAAASRSVKFDPVAAVAFAVEQRTPQRCSVRATHRPEQLQMIVHRLPRHTWRAAAA